MRPPEAPDHDLLLQDRIVLLQGPITDDLAHIVIAKLLYLQFDDPDEPITLAIDSDGGLVGTSLAIVDTIKSLTPPVRTECRGAAWGMAAVVLAFGVVGQRRAKFGSRIGIATLTSENAKETEKELAKTRRLVAKVLAERVRPSIEAIEHDLQFGRSLTLEDAKRYGVIDQVG